MPYIWVHVAISYQMERAYGTLELKPSMVGHTCNPRIQKAEPGGLEVLGQPRLHIETLLKKLKKKKKKTLSSCNSSEYK
jgi:hypothetical protein